MNAEPLPLSRRRPRVVAKTQHTSPGPPRSPTRTCPWPTPNRHTHARARIVPASRQTRPADATTTTPSPVVPSNATTCPYAQHAITRASGLRPTDRPSSSSPLPAAALGATVDPRSPAWNRWTPRPVGWVAPPRDPGPPAPRSRADASRRSASPGRPGEECPPGPQRSTPGEPQCRRPTLPPGWSPGSNQTTRPPPGSERKTELRRPRHALRPRPRPSPRHQPA